MKAAKLANMTKYIQFFYPYVENGKSVKIEIKGLTAATTYTGYWAASNPDILFA